MPTSAHTRMSAALSYLRRNAVGTTTACLEYRAPGPAFGRLRGVQTSPSTRPQNGQRGVRWYRIDRPEPRFEKCCCRRAADLRRKEILLVLCCRRSETDWPENSAAPMRLLEQNEHLAAILKAL